MSKQSENDVLTKSQSSSSRSDHILGLPMSDLAGVTVDEIINNKPALTMVMHYYKQLADENTSLKNDLNTAGTYVSGYEKKKTDTSVGAILQFFASICIGFGINLLTSDNAKPAPGVILLSIGILLQICGLYYALRTR